MTIPLLRYVFAVAPWCRGKAEKQQQKFVMQTTPVKLTHRSSWCDGQQLPWEGVRPF